VVLLVERQAGERGIGRIFFLRGDFYVERTGCVIGQNGLLRSAWCSMKDVLIR
jgi:hypothetical protein